MFLIDDIIAANAAKKLVPMLVGGGIMLAAGFTAAEVYEHKAPWGLGPKRDALYQEIHGQPNGWDYRLRVMTSRRDNREAARAACEVQRGKDNAAATSNVERGGDERAAARGAGFDEGYAAGQVAGRLKCKKEDADATTDDGAGRGSAPAGGVQNPGAWADDWNRHRYDPGPAVRPQRPGG